MLPRSQRLTDADGFAAVVRHGQRAASTTLVVHLLVEPQDQEAYSSVRFGFVVSKAVGQAVTRNRVKRRLRNQARRLVAATDRARFPGPVVLVVRALPAAAGASSAELGSDLERCVHRVMNRVAV